jgi:hypothetical protein
MFMLCSLSATMAVLCATVPVGKYGMVCAAQLLSEARKAFN